MSSSPIDFPDVVVCAKCGSLAGLTEAESLGWLVGWANDGSGRLIVRCLRHQSQHARRLVGVPGRVSLKRIGDRVAGGLSFKDGDGARWYASSWMLEGDNPEESFLLQRCVGSGIPETVSWEFRSLAGLVLAMSRVADLRRWYATGSRP